MRIKYHNLVILMVEDDPKISRLQELILKSAGVESIIVAPNGKTALEKLNECNIDIVLLDLGLPDISGIDILDYIRNEYPGMQVIVATAVDETETAVKCMKKGAYDYLVKPIQRSNLIRLIKHAIELQEVQKENHRLKCQFLSGKLHRSDTFSSIVTQNEKMLTLFQYIEVIAQTNQPVLITGETGVGKELFARAVHDNSDRNNFTAVNIAGIDDNSFSDTLFGHKKGAFTGADLPRIGLIEQAVNGTLFLDEIGDLTENSQIKLLRFLEHREYYPLGSDIPKQSQVRIIAATNHDLNKLQQEKKFRKDLYFRLATHHIHIIPLRERKDDMGLLLDYFLEKASFEIKRKKPDYPKKLVTILKSYPFPGNVRELETMIFEACNQHYSGLLSSKIFIDIMRRNGFSAYEELETMQKELLSFSKTLPTLKETSQLLIEEALKRTQGNQTQAARLLGISHQALSRRIKKYKEAED